VETFPPDVAVRRATPDDAASLRTWRNDVAVRSASRRPGVVTAADHLAWLRALWPDPDRHLLIAEADGVPVGQVRFDRIGPARFEISVSVAVRGRGLGSAAIVAGVGWLAAAEGPALVEAQIRDQNLLSARAFRSAGFADAAPTEAGFRRLTHCASASGS